MKQFGIFGLGSFGMTVAKELADKKFNVLAIDSDPERVNIASEFVAHTVICDATDEKALRDAGAENIDIAIVSVGKDISASVMITLNLKEIGIKYIVAKATNPNQGRVLKKIGADRVIFPERDMAVRLVQQLTNPSIFEYLEFSPDYGLMEIVAPKSFEDKTIKEIDLRKKYGITLIAIKRANPVVDKNGETQIKELVLLSPSPDESIIKGDILVIIGSYENLEKYGKTFGR